MEPGLLSGFHEQRKYGWPRKSKTWDGKNWIPSEEFDEKHGKDINPRTGTFYGGTQFVRGAQQTISSGISTVNEQLNKVEIPEVLQPGIDLLEGAVEKPVQGLLSGVLSGYQALPENVKKNIASGGATILNTLEKSTLGYSQQFNLHPILTDTAFAVGETVLTAGAGPTSRFIGGGGLKTLATSFKSADNLALANVNGFSNHLLRNTIEEFTPNTVFAAISKEGKATSAYAKWRADGAKWYAKNKNKQYPMKGFREFVDPKTKEIYTLGSSHTGKLTNISKLSRAIRNAKRKGTTQIKRESVEQIMKKYNQPPEMVDAFMNYQSAGKKKLDDLIAKINARIKENPEAYPGVKASLGHIRAASRYDEAGDILSNINLENFFINVKRSNLDEVSDPFNRALGVSLNLDEEVLKFIDKDLGDFFTGFGLGRKQKEVAKNYVRSRMDKKIDWKSIKTPSGEQLFKNKEEYLINEALQFVSKD